MLSPTLLVRVFLGLAWASLGLVNRVGDNTLLVSIYDWRLGLAFICIFIKICKVSKRYKKICSWPPHPPFHHLGHHMHFYRPSIRYQILQPRPCRNPSLVCFAYPTIQYCVPRPKKWFPSRFSGGTFSVLLTQKKVVVVKKGQIIIILLKAYLLDF